MAEPFIGEVRLFGFNYAPRNWAFCDGAILPIAQNQSLYALLGTQFGGDGRTSFALPDLRSRVPVHRGDGFNQGARYGAETVTLEVSQIAAHTHTLNASNDPATSSNISNDETTNFAQANGNVYVESANLTQLSTQTGTPTGGGQAHENRQPTLAVNFSIAMLGIFPSRN
ncbi:phage tail protein [Aliikangiella coralliicola]|uniref:Phage tail protein n=1 Tax=Aliikangiella coralliicola TaxID=2592383 RepID=A0A545U798_9GAMM|nr:tail fiber protein [Aliikangiella coralliicola]TQV85346.1 phage tail protein [Aliikangiella coralliicola]